VRVALFACLLPAAVVLANIPGGGDGTGPNVTVTDNGDGTVTMANGLVSIHIIKSGAAIDQINYTCNNGGGPVTNQLLAGGKYGGEFYWEFGGWGGNPWVYSLVTNSGSYAEVDLYSDSATNGLVDIHFSMLRGSPGFYATPIWSHRAQDGAFGTGEERDNIYLAPYFNWQSVDAGCDFEAVGMSNVPAFYSPQENSLVVAGNLEGTYVDKYKWSADFGVERVWGWSSVSDAAWNFTGQNIGIWHVVASGEFYNGGPLKPELNDAPMVNMINGGHYYFGNDSGFAAGEIWTRASGPYFIYVNNVTNTLTDPVQASRALFADAQAQATAEAGAWPYSWMNNPNYAPAAQRGLVTGQIVINDPYNPNASASNLWVGVEQQPSVTINNVYDFQLWMKPYEFWTKSDANGNFVISNVIAGNNYTLYAFGPGAEGMFMSKNQNGGYPGINYNLPATQFTVVVTGGATNNLGAVTWTPTRVGPTVFEIGYPDRKGDKFRHGDDYWVGDIGPSPAAPSPVWTKFLEFPFDFPNGLNYVVGQNRWTTDWNFIQSVYPDFAGNNTVSSSTVTFNLAADPASGATAAVLMGIASDDDSPIYVTVNGTLLSGGNATGTPTASLPTSGWFPNNDISDANIREENHGGYSDEWLTFAGNLLHAGNNTINFSFRQAGGSGFTHHFIYDYLRLELTGYVPPAPAGVMAWPGNNCNLVCWPVTPGATSYNILRSTTSGGGYVSLTNGVTGPVCGSGPANAVYVDNTAVNGTAYYYEVQSVNPVNASGNSPPSAGATPSAGIATNVPATPAGVAVTSTNNAVTFTWNAVPGANFYTICRGTVVNKLGYVPAWIILSDTATSPAYTDASGTLGCTYSYFVTATSAAGTSGNSAVVTAKPVPPPPAAAPGNVQIADAITPTNQSNFISWSPVSGAVGYILYRANNPAGPFSFPGNYLQSMMTTNYYDGGLATNTLYSYLVIAMNAGGISSNSVVVSTPPAAPASLNAYPGNSQIQLVWSASVGATNYLLERGGGSGAETVLATTTNTTFTDTGVVNGANYYYVVIAAGTGGNSLKSIEVSAAGFVGPPAIYWINNLTGSAQSWNVNSNWSNGAAFPNGVQASAIVNSAIGANQTINLNQPITVGNLSLGAAGGAFNLTNNGGALTFDNTPGSPSLWELSASKGDTISTPVTLNGLLSVSNAAANPLTVSGVISGANGLVVLGPGTLVLSGNNTFSGPTTVEAGTLQLNSATAASTNAIVLTGGATLYGNNISIGNVITNSGTNTWTSYGSGTYYPGASLTGSGQLNLNITGSGVFSPGGNWSQFAGTIAWAAGNGAGCRFYGMLGSANASWNLGASTGNIYNRNGGVTISFGALSGGSQTALYGASTAAAATTYSIGALNQNSTFNGRISDGGDGTTALAKVGAGVLTLTGTNTYSGGTAISGGTLMINNTGGSGTGSGAVTVATGGALGGTGVISGPVTVQSGGALAPGNPLGTLTISNNLTLAAGSATLLQLQHSPRANNAVNVSGALLEGGTLIVTNLGAGAWSAGDSFKLFNAPSYTGSFAGFVLPPLTGNLVWNTNTFKNSGVLSVVALTPPAIGNLRISGGQLVISGSGGAGSWPFWLLATTNLAAAQWAPIATSQFDAAGNFTLTNTLNPGSPRTFYRLQLQ
jgi:rhamnogalacturonan endolyase